MCSIIFSWFQTNMAIDWKFTTSWSLSPQTLTHIMTSWCLKSILQNSYLQEEEVLLHIQADAAGGASELVTSQWSLLHMSAKKHKFILKILCGLYVVNIPIHPWKTRIKGWIPFRIVFSNPKDFLPPSISQRGKNLQIKEWLTVTFIQAHLIGGYFTKRKDTQAPTNRGSWEVSCTCTRWPWLLGIRSSIMDKHAKTTPSL